MTGPIAALPVAWWTFWFASALALYLALVWVLLRLAGRVDEDAREHPPAVVKHHPEGGITA